MAKWLILAIGTLLMANGFYTRTYDFPNETPVRYCFNMDYLGVGGCFYNETMPLLIAWLPFLLGIGLVIWSRGPGSVQSGERLRACYSPDWREEEYTGSLVAHFSENVSQAIEQGRRFRRRCKFFEDAL